MNPLNAIRDMRTIGRLLSDAERRARALGDDEPGAVHLFLAAVDLDDAARRVMQPFGIGSDEIEAAIVEEHRDGLVAAGIDEATATRMTEPRPVEPSKPGGVYRSEGSGQELFQVAGELARRQRQRFTGVHVLLAATRVEHGLLARVLDRLGVDRAAMARAAEEAAAAR